MGFQPVGKTAGQILAGRRKVKRSGLRQIDAGTRYDLTGNLRRIAREIERGELGDVRDLIVISRVVAGARGGRSVELRHFGMASIEEAHWMLTTAANRMEPS